MTAHQRGRLIMPALRIDQKPLVEVQNEACRLIEEVGPCGFLIFGGRADEVGALTQHLVRQAGRPLLMAADLERGAGQQFAGLSRIQTPMAIAACPAAAELAFEAGRVTAIEALSIGVNLLFAPVCDVNTEPTNPIINVRSFSSKAETVAELASEWIMGAQAAGALACAKHFPGHGATTSDSHSELPEGVADPEELRSVHLVPFASACSVGVRAVMTAHITAPAVEKDPIPATLSAAAVRGLLRGEIGYDGLVITDALIMKGLARAEGDAAVTALRAGCDILLYPSDPAAILEILKRTDGNFTRSLQRIDTALADAGERLTHKPIDAKKLGERIADGCLTLVSGTVSKPKAFAVICDAPRMDPTVFRDAMRDAHVPEVAPSDFNGDPADLLIAVFSLPSAWQGLAGAEAKSLSRIPRGAGVISFGDPYFLRRLETPAFAIAAYDDHAMTQTAACDLILSCGVFRGRLPV